MLRAIIFRFYLAYYSAAYITIRTILALIYQIKFNLIDRIGIWIRMRRFKKNRRSKQIKITSENLSTYPVADSSMRPLEIRT